MLNRSSVLGAYFQGPPEDRAEGTELVKNSAMRWVRWIDPDHRCPDNPFRGRQRVLARLYLKDADEHRYMDRGAEGAVAYAALMRPRIEKLKEMDIWDVGGPNEPHPTKATAPLHDAFTCKLVDLYYGWDMKLAGWDWGVGWPGLRRFGDEARAQIGMAHQTARSVDLMRQADGGVVVHEYNAPSVLNEGGNNDDSRTLRIKYTLAEWADAGVDVDNLRVIIGECGLDRSVMPGQPQAGWMSFKSWVYPSQYGLQAGAMTDERYWLQMSALDDEYVKIKQIVAAFPFITNPWGQWASFNWPGPFIRRATEKHARVIAPPPDPDQPALAPVHAFLDRLPFSRKAAIALGLEFLDEVQTGPTAFAAVCVDRSKGQYVALPVQLVDSAWVAGQSQPLERPLTA